MLSATGLVTTSILNPSKRRVKLSTKLKKVNKKKKGTNNALIAGCVGIKLPLIARRLGDNPYSHACSMRCRHPTSDTEVLKTSRSMKIPSEDWLTEDIYKQYTETDSRPLTPDGRSKRSKSVPEYRRLSNVEFRNCKTPEPKSRKCTIYDKRSLVLDLRKVRSFENIYLDKFSTFSSTDKEERKEFHHVFLPHASRNDNSLRSGSTSPIKRKASFGENSPRGPKLERTVSLKAPKERPLPPLHSSVLTLLKLGNLSKSKSLDLEQNIASENKQKLRRHGRKGSKPKKISDNSKDDAENEERGSKDEERLSQLDVDTVEDEKLRYRSLHNVLDELDYTSRWRFKEMEEAEEEIKILEAELEKFETKFKSRGISIKEEDWLSYPRTWCRSNASFRFPTNLRKLKGMAPLVYLKSYVCLSKSREHLFNLIFERYRTFENPTGDTVPYYVMQKAMSEVVGHQLTEEEIEELSCRYLDVVNPNLSVDEDTFKGICAFCERIFARFPCKTKTRRHGQKTGRHFEDEINELEKADFSYVLERMKRKCINSKLEPLLLAIAERTYYRESEDDSSHADFDESDDESI